MNCKHRPASYTKLLTEGDAGMVCRHCKKPIRTKDRQKADLFRRLLVIVPLVLFCVIAATDISDGLGKAALLGCFLGCLAVSVIGWLILCRFVLEYEEVPEKAENDPENA